MSELVPFADIPVQAVFDWDATVAETKDLRRQEEELADRIRLDLIELNKVKLKIGLNLIIMQEKRANNKSGDFIEFAMKEFSIQNRQDIYDYIHVAENLRDYIVNGRLQYSWEIMRLLGQRSMPEVIVQQVASGAVSPTVKDIQEARKAQRQAEERAAQAEERLTIFEDQEQPRRAEITHLSMQIKALEQQIATQSVQAPIPPEITAQLEKLQSDLKERTSDLKERTKERDNLAKVREEQRQSLEEYRNANRAAREQELYETRVKQNLQQITDAFQRAVTPLLSQFPSVFDVQVFDHQDWSRLDHAIEVVQRFLAECERLRARPTALIIDAG